MGEAGGGGGGEAGGKSARSNLKPPKKEWLKVAREGVRFGFSKK